MAGRIHIAQSAEDLRAASDASKGLKGASAAADYAAAMARVVIPKRNADDPQGDREARRKEEEEERERVGAALRYERIQARKDAEDKEYALLNPKKHKREPQKGDWECPTCGWDNYARNKVCYKRECDEPRPLTKAQRKRRREKLEEEEREADKKRRKLEKKEAKKEKKEAKKRKKEKKDKKSAKKSKTDKKSSKKKRARSPSTSSSTSSSSASSFTTVGSASSLG
eukprot:TRINITY_DN1717_c0_g1_i1.p1 TRINITY_DN1717_c0_g1~~TRINITY_DN1717_c0_g1_i1.p1  ORF type:complete len:242 (+),score=144.78 TRINITY_DN1717_c0_g1_i1:49-726(+)